MAAFNFRLARVLDIKRIREREKQFEWVRAMRERELQQHAEIALRTESKEFAGRRKHSSAVGELRIEAEIAGGLRRQIRRQHMNVIRALSEENAAQSRLIESMKERKALEKLRERKLEEHNLDENRRERSAMDAVATRRFFDLSVRSNEASHEAA